MSMEHNEFMQKIEKLEGQVMEEVDGSREYMNCSSKWSAKDPSIASIYASMAKQELDHATKLNSILLDLHSKPEMDDDQKAVIKFLTEMNASQIKRASMER